MEELLTATSTLSKVMMTPPLVPQGMFVTCTLAALNTRPGTADIPWQTHSQTQTEELSAHCQQHTLSVWMVTWIGAYVSSRGNLILKPG